MNLVTQEVTRRPVPWVDRNPFDDSRPQRDASAVLNSFREGGGSVTAPDLLRAPRGADEAQARGPARKVSLRLRLWLRLQTGLLHLQAPAAVFAASFATCATRPAARRAIAGLLSTQVSP